VGVEIVKHQADLARMRVECRKLLTKQREFALGASLLHLSKPASAERFNRRQQHTRAEFLILVVLFGNLAFAHRAWQQRIANQETRPLVETHHRIAGVIRLGVQPQNVLQLCQKRGINLREAPGLLQMRLEFVFLSTSRTKV
jgi:hypothetical protein